ncbi:MAG: mechanosensitive ion channel family protein [Rhizobiales bacterium]|nr:mechanosensitive ion channel family protein [Hyphomicrobiales bacterium]
MVFGGSVRYIAAIVTALILLGFASVSAKAQTEAAKPPQKVEELLKLLGDPDVQKWIDAQKAAEAQPPAAAQTKPNDDAAMDAAFERIRAHLVQLAEAIPALPSEIARVAGQIGNALQGYGPIRLLIIFLVFMAAGIAAEWIFRRFTGGIRAWIAGARLDSIFDRLIAMAERLAYSAASLGVFAAGSIGAFLAFTWPQLLGPIIVGYLVAVLIFRAARLVFEFILSPPEYTGFGEPSRYRVLPVSDASASFWVRRISYAIGWYAFGYTTVMLMGALGFTVPTRLLAAYALGAVLLVMGIEAVWNRPDQVKADAAEPGRGRLSAGAKNWLITIYFISLWVFWVMSAWRLFWLLVVVVGLPFAVSAVRRAVNNVLRPPGQEQGGKEIPSVLAAVIERGVRAALVIAAVIFLGHKLGIDFTAITAQDTVLTRIMRGAFSAIVILLAADFFWHVAKTLIDRKMVEASALGEPGTELARRRARVRTLLPIVRNVLMIIVAVVAILMALSSLGVEIGPLIAGAGIVGVAVGFGAQTVVKDVISGVFYLLDDAFRVGEYIQSKSYKGTVEAFSLRSVKLRHHRGYVYTVPFSELGAVQNMSRDWVIEKITMTVTYDSDVDKARKIVKKIGQDLAQDPEYAASIIEPLKMQGVDEFGDSGLVLRMKLKTRPGEQFTIKRRALMLIKKAFDENNIKLAFPTIQVAGEDEGKAAAALQLRMKQQQAAAEAAAAADG